MNIRKIFQYAKRFIQDEDGSELVQWAVVVAIAVILAAVAITISDVAGQKLEDAKDYIDQLPIPKSGTP